MKEKVSRTLQVSELGSEYSLVGAIAEARDALSDPGLGTIDISLEGNLNNLDISQIDAVVNNLQALARWLKARSRERMCIVNVWFATNEE